MTEIRCPHCSFSKEVDLAALPPKINRVTCPRCKESFPLQQEKAPVESIPPVEKQPESQAAPAVQEVEEELTTADGKAEMLAVPKAGFWLRFVAAMLDGVLVGIMQAVLGGLLLMAGMFNGSNGEGLGLLVQIFTFLLSMFYYIFFTGYGGQTPGKMALRIKVVRCDGSKLTYGRAAFRELPAKFISGIIFAIGYLMAAFDEQKQALHDRMADTYVIKL